MRGNASVIASNIYVLNAGGGSVYLAGSYTSSMQIDARTGYIGLTAVSGSPLTTGCAALIELGSATGPVNGFISFNAEL
jgi:hypothetical protein